CTTLSVALNVYLYVHALYTGGYPFYHPVELMCIRWGSLTALLSIVAASAGKGRGRIPLAIIFSSESRDLVRSRSCAMKLRSLNFRRESFANASAGLGAAEEVAGA